MRKNSTSKLFWIGILLLVVPGLVHAYLLIPFPASQNLNAITICYYLEKIVLPLRVAGAVVIIWYLFKSFSANSAKGKIVKLAVLALCLGSFYFSDFAYKAESMF